MKHRFNYVAAKPTWMLPITDTSAPPPSSLLLAMRRQTFDGGIGIALAGAGKGVV